MPICDKCGWKTNSDRIFNIHVKTCTVEPAPEEAKPEIMKYEDMTNNELKDILEAMEKTLPRPANKTNLIAAIKEGESQ